MRLAGGSPQADLCSGAPHRFLNGTPEVAHRRTTIGVPNRNPLQTQGLPASRITTREVPHKHNYDQGGSAQAELRPGRIPTRRITTSEVAGWLAGGITIREVGTLDRNWVGTLGRNWVETASQLSWNWVGALGQNWVGTG